MKARIKFEIAVEYEMSPDCYPAGSTFEQMLEIDLETVNEDRFMLLGGDNASWVITGELLNSDHDTCTDQKEKLNDSEI